MRQLVAAVSDNRHEDYEIERRMLQEAGIELKVFDCRTEEDMIASCADVDAVFLDMAPMSAKVVAALKQCKIVNRYGVGFDNVDVEACTEKQIWVSNVPDYCAEDVSDHAVALLFSCLRQVALRDRRIREGKWNIHEGESFRICGKTCGVLGAGRIARAFIRKMQGFNLKEILVYDPFVDADTIAKLGARKAELEEVFSEADFLSLHMPVTSETRNMINEKTLSLMKKTAILINTARGALVNDAALIQALRNGQIAYAGLDTHNTEPLTAESEYVQLNNVVLTDHTAYNTKEAVIELKTKAAQNVILALKGEKPTYPINKIQ